MLFDCKMQTKDSLVISACFSVSAINEVNS